LGGEGGGAPAVAHDNERQGDFLATGRGRGRLHQGGGRPACRRVRDERVAVLHRPAHGAVQHAALELARVGREPGDFGQRRRRLDQEIRAGQRLHDGGEPAQRRGSANTVTVEPAAALSPAAGHVWCTSPHPLRTTWKPRRCSARSASRRRRPVTSGTARAGWARALSGAYGQFTTYGTIPSGSSSPTRCAVGFTFARRARSS